MSPLGPAVRLTASPPIRLFRLVLGSHDGTALVPIPKRSASPWGDIDIAAADSLKVLDLNRPIREATFVTRLQPCQLPGRAARQLPDQSTTLWVESSSTSDPRLRGALPKGDIMYCDATCSLRWHLSLHRRTVFGIRSSDGGCFAQKTLDRALSYPY